MATNRSNVLLIMTDQQRWDAVGANGNDRIRTPHLDSLARDGVSFRHSYTCAMACVPSRACIMSGQYVHAHGVTSTNPDLQHWLRPETPTLPGCFTAAGYNTVGVGKMHFSPWNALSGFQRIACFDVWPEREDEYSRVLRQAGLTDKTIGHHTPGFGKAFKSMPSLELPVEYHVDGYTGWRGVENLEKLLKKPEPFFLKVSFPGPHDPYDPPRPYDTMYDQAEMPIGPYCDGELDCLPPHVLRDAVDMGIEHLNLTTVPEAKKREVKAYYYSKISLIDDWIGKLLDTLKAHGEYENTVLLFTSDHGDYLGDHNLYYKAYFPCESDCRIPFILKAPGVPAGATPEELVGNVDIMPTLLDAAGLAIPPTCQGMSVLPLASGKVDRVHECIVTFSETGPAYRLRTPEWAYVFREGNGHDQLYHLPDDPDELDNLTMNPRYANMAEQLRRMLLAWFMAHPAPCSGRVPFPIGSMP